MDSEINQRLQDIETKIDVYMAQQCEICNAQKEKMFTVERHLYGNGKPGLIERVQNLSLYMKIIAFIGGGTIIALIGVLVDEITR